MKSAKDILIRAGKTFIQAFGAYIITYAAAAVNNLDLSDGKAVKYALLGLIVSAVASGISAVMNVLINKYNANKATYLTGVVEDGKGE